MSTSVSPQIMLEVALRVSAELGRCRMPVSTAVGLPPGAIVELDRGHDEAIDLYVNDRHFGTGRLLVVEGEWVVRIESVDGVATTPGPVVADEAEIRPITPVNLSSSDQG